MPNDETRDDDALIAQRAYRIESLSERNSQMLARLETALLGLGRHGNGGLIADHRNLSTSFDAYKQASDGRFKVLEDDLTTRRATARISGAAWGAAASIVLFLVQQLFTRLFGG